IFFWRHLLRSDSTCLVDLADLTAPATSAVAAAQLRSALPTASVTLADAARGTRSATAVTASAAAQPSAKMCQKSQSSRS
ncbi:hypothetical protein AVEN_217114-2-1, partial [Araneus ventricosus]